MHGGGGPPDEFEGLPLPPPTPQRSPPVRDVGSPSAQGRESLPAQEAGNATSDAAMSASDDSPAPEIPWSDKPDSDQPGPEKNE